MVVKFSLQNYFASDKQPHNTLRIMNMPKKGLEDSLLKSYLVKTLILEGVLYSAQSDRSGLPLSNSNLHHA